MDADLKPPLARLRPRDQLFYVSRNRTVLATSRDGFIHGEGAQGLFILQTRVLSLLRYWINGQVPEPVGVSNLREYRQVADYVIASPTADRDLFQGALGSGGRAATEAIELRLSRTVGDGLREDIELTNHTLRPASVTLEIALRADFADPTETHGERWRHGCLERSWRVDSEAATLSWRYNYEHSYSHQGNRGVASVRQLAAVRFSGAERRPMFDEGQGRVRFAVELPAHGVWQCSMLVAATLDGRNFDPQHPTDYEDKREGFLAESTVLDGPAPPLAFSVSRSFEQARRDLIALRLYDLDSASGGWTLAAGLPVYIALFGRDALTAAWQAALVTPDLMKGALQVLADTQAEDQNDWYDAQPGRFVHQMDTGPLATLMYNPHAHDYGSLTGPGFYPVVLSNLWHWTGDQETVSRFLEPALRGLDWLDRSARREDGFYAYRSRSEQGVKNQSWKDSYDAIVYPDGSQVKDPIASAEFQAFVFAAKVRISELLWWCGEKQASKRFFDEAMILRERFNDAYWMEDEDCFGMGLDPAGRLIRSVGSESLHAIAAGIVHHDRVSQVVDRLFQPDLFSGWGVRTLSSRHPAFNPFSYHRGSVWPAEQAAFCMGLMRYGLHSRLQTIASAQFEVAAIFEHWRLPEVFSGHQRDEHHPIPSLSPNADSPQAWSASAVPCIVQALLGIFPFAPLHCLFLDPHLPDWLPNLQLRNIRVGAASVDLRFRRTRDGETEYEVANRAGDLHVIRQPSPWSLTTDFAERVSDAISSLLPGR